MLKKFLYLIAVSTSFGAFANSQDIMSYEDNSVTVHIPSATDEGQLRTLKFLNLPVTRDLQQRHQKFLDEKMFSYEQDYSQGIRAFTNEHAKDLGMNDTPVLDQGQYGTCATFGLTGFLDAYLGKGDAIDQQCILALSKTLGQNLWNGGEPANIYNLLQSYGIVEKNHCFGSQYPDQNQFVYPSQYAQISNRDYLSRKYLQNIYVSVNQIKNEIDLGRRVLLTVYFSGSESTTDPVSVNGFNIVVNGEKKKGGGLWACSQASSYTNYCAQMNVGHVVTIIGYDDAQKLFKIRNSWGAAYGDSGNYYMTYEFLQAMGRDVAVLKN